MGLAVRGLSSVECKATANFNFLLICSMRYFSLVSMSTNLSLFLWASVMEVKRVGTSTPFFTAFAGGLGDWVGTVFFAAVCAKEREGGLEAAASRQTFSRAAETDVACSVRVRVILSSICLKDSFIRSMRRLVNIS